MRGFPEAIWFFTANLAERQENQLLIEKIDLLLASFESVGLRHPFRQEAFVIMPDHLHSIWTLPPDDTDFSIRWSQIKGQFSRGIEKMERVSQSRMKRRETRHLAASILGASDSGMMRISATCGLHPLESGQAWMGK